MNRARLAFAATLIGATCAAGTAFAQAPPLQPILSGKKFVPPIKGPAEVEFTKPVTKRDKDIVITKIEVKNISTAPIARLTVAETWYDKAGAVVAGGKGTINGLLQAGEVQSVTIETPYSAKMSANNFNFTHANGTVKPQRVDKIVTGEGKDAPAGKASAAKAPATKKK